MSDNRFILTPIERERAKQGVNGVLRRSWETHCVRCERPALGLGYGGPASAAIAELRRDGWTRREGYWTCPICPNVLVRP